MEAPSFGGPPSFVPTGDLYLKLHFKEIPRG